MKRIATVVVLMAVFAIMCASATFATENSFGENSTIRIGYVPNFTTINEPVVVDGEGYGYEYFQEIAKTTKWNYEFVACNVEEGMQLLKSGEIDLFGPNQWLGIEQSGLIETQNDFGNMSIVLLAGQNENIAYNDCKEIDKKRVGVIENSVYEPYLLDYCNKNNTEVEIVYITNAQILNPDENACDLFLTSGQKYIEGTKIIARLGVVPVKFIATEKNKELIDKIDDALNVITMNDFTYSYKLYNKYYSERDYEVPPLTEQEQEALKEIGVMRVGYGADYAPMEYTDENGQATGISVDLMNYIGQKAGIRIEYIPMYRNIEYDSDDFDAVIAYTQKEILNGYKRTSQQYTQRSLMMIGNTLADSIDKENIIGIIDYTFCDLSGLKTVLPSYTIKVYETVEELNVAFVNEEITHFVATTISVDTVAANIGTKNYSIYNISQQLPFKIRYSERISEDLISAIDKVIVTIDDSTRDIAYLENVQKLQTEYKWSDFVKKNIAEILLLILAVMLLTIIIIVNNSMKNAQKMKSLLETDSQTGMLTLYKFKKEATKIIEKAKPNEYMLISIDINNFKYINENFGYVEGTNIIRILGKAISTSIGKNQIICRVYGDKFSILCHTIEKDNLKVDLEFSRKNLLKHLDESELERLSKISISIGCYCIVDTTMDISAMMDLASFARKSAKHRYDNTITVYNDKMNQQREIANFITGKELDAIKNKEFVLCFQPRIEIATNKVVGVETLVRWVSDGRVISPLDFIQVFERNGFIVELDVYVITNAFKTVENYFMKKDSSFKTSVNVSRFTLFDEDAVERILNIAKKYSKEFISRMEIEITENSVAANESKLINSISKLKNAGFSIAMDDFGTEYSSISSLLQIDVDIVKLDKCIVDSLEKESGKIFVKSVIDMLQNLNYKVIVEGVGTKEQIDFLMQFNDIIVQGYYYAKPMYLDDVLYYCDKMLRIDCEI